MDSGYIINSIMSLLLRKVRVPKSFHDQVEVVKDMLEDDVTGLIDSLTDFSVESATVDFSIETPNPNLTESLNRWLDEVNIDYRGEIPSGIKSLAREYYKERWKYSSFPVLKIAEWGNIDGILVPTKLFFVKGESIHAKPKENNTEKLKLLNYDYYLGRTEEEKLGKNVVFSKPYGRWFDKYPIPYLIKRGIYHNYTIIKAIKDKQATILEQIIPYLLLIKKGTEGLATQNIKTYSNKDLTDVVDQFKGLVKELEKQNVGDKQNKTPIRARNFDEEIKHLIPDIKSIFEPELFQTAEQNILAGLGFIDIAEAVSNSRRESILNPKAFMTEVNDGVEGFKQILKELIYLIREKNSSKIKYNNVKFNIVSSPIKAFMTDKFKDRVRQAYDRGVISMRTYTELVPEGHFDIEVNRRDKEAKDGMESLMYPHLIRNDEEKGIDFTGDQPSKEVDEDDIPEEKRNEVERQNYDMAKLVGVTSITNGHYHSYSIDDNGDGETSENEGHYHEITRFKVQEEDGHTHELMGTDQATHHDKKDKKKKKKIEYSEDNLVTAPYKSPADLPGRVKDNMSSDLQKVFIRVFNKAYEQYDSETRAFRTAWSVIRKIGRKNKKGMWIRKKKRVNGKLEPIKLDRSMILEALEEEEKEIINEAIEKKKMEIAVKQSELLDKLLGKNKE